MALSIRGSEWATMSDRLNVWKKVKDLWHPISNPGGIVNLGLAKNVLMHQEMVEYVRSNIVISEKSFTYGNGGIGSEALLTAVAQFLNRYFKPDMPIEPSHICMTNGVSSAMEHLSNLLANPGDAIVLGRPYYGFFIRDIELRTGAKAECVSFGDTDPFSLEAVAYYEETIKLCQNRCQRVAALLICNPHNPLGRCYPLEVLCELMKLCSKHSVHLVSDEIYALSVFRSPTAPHAQVDHGEIPTRPEFTPVCSILTDSTIDPSLVHTLWGISKDFGANGLRVGCILSQRNTELHRALVPQAIYSHVSSLSDMITAKLLTDTDYVDQYIRENHRRLFEHYGILVNWAEKHQIEYGKDVSAGFFLWLNLGEAFLRTSKTEETQSELMSTEEELDKSVGEILLREKVFVASGAAFGGERRGWFRVTFSQSKSDLKEGLRRIEVALGLLKKT